MALPILQPLPVLHFDHEPGPYPMRAACPRAVGGCPSEQEVALQDARREVAHIATAIRQGILTPTTRTMLEEAEARVARLEQAVRDLKRRPAPVASFASSVRRYLDDLRGTLETNVEEARRLLARGLDRIVLRRGEDGHLWAEVRGNLSGILQLNDGGLLAGVGAGRGI
jgi:hypothetical protein